MSAVSSPACCSASASARPCRAATARPAGSSRSAKRHRSPRCSTAAKEIDCDFEATCSNNNTTGIYIVGGLIGLLGFRVWEIVDAVGGPSKHNRKVRELKMRLGIPVPMYTHRVIPYVNKTRDGGGTAGVMFRF
jgi:hypothetical protein